MPSRKMTLKRLRKPKPRYPQTTLVADGSPEARIVRPADEAYAAIAEAVQGRVKELTGVRLPIVPDTRVSARPKQNLVLLGNLNTNRVVFRLYGQSYTPADDLYPGRGGYLMHTIHDPWGHGKNAIGLFGSDLRGVEAAARKFCDGLRGRKELKVGRLFDLKLGPDGMRVPGVTDEPEMEAEKAAAEEALQRGTHTGLWSRIGQRGLLYGLTGKDVYAEMYRWLVYRMYEHAMSDPDNYGGIWGFDADFALQYVMPGWDLVEESPVITDRDRLRITRILFEFISDCVSHVGNVSRRQVRHNHSTYAALGLLYAGTYYSKYYDAREADDWLKLSRRCLSVQAEAYKPSEDCGHYQWRTHVHTMRYALTTGDTTFFDNGCAQRAADYAILTSDNLGCGVPNGDTSSPFGTFTEIPYLKAMVCVTGDGRYQWMLDRKLEIAPRYPAYEHSRIVEPVEPVDLNGTQVFPVDPMYYETNNGKDHLPLKKTFDKVVMRDGFDPENQYLFLDGLSNGGHKHYDGNSICRLTENRRIWLADCDYIKSLPKFHNGVLIFRNGQSAPIPDFAELERAAGFDRSGFSETTLRKYSGADWHRNIIWNRGKYFLVADEMTARSEADYSFRAVWQTLGDVVLTDGGMTVVQNGEHFAIKGLPGPRLKLEDDAVTGKNWAAYEHAEPVVRILQQIVDVRLKKGETYTYFNLLYCSDEAQPQDLAMTQVTDGAVRIDGGAEVVFAGVGDPSVAQKIPGGPEVAAAQFHVSASRYSLVDATSLSWGNVKVGSDAPVSLEYDLVRQEGQVCAARPTVLELSTGADGRVLVDGKEAQTRRRKGHLSIPIPKGEHRIALVAESVAALGALASRPARPRIRGPRPVSKREGRVPQLKTVWQHHHGGTLLSVRAADLDGDGADEVVVGGAPGSIVAVKSGKPAWQFDAKGAVRSVWTADLEGDGRVSVIAGSEDTNVYVLDEQGRKKWSAEVPFYFQTPVVRSVFTGDLNGDGKLEVVAAVESWRYHAFTHDGKPMWRAMTVRPSSTGCAADLDGDGCDEVIAGTDYHRWHCIDGGGDIRWSYHPPGGPRANSATAGDVDGDGLKEAIFAGADTNIHVLKPDGQVLWRFNTGDEVTQVIAADLDGDGRDEVVASSMSFNVYAVRGDGKRQLWRTDLQEVVRCVAVGDLNGDGKLEVAAGTDDGRICVLANGDGRLLGRFDTGSGVTAMVTGDVDGDGVAEVLATCEDGSLYALKS